MFTRDTGRMLFTVLAIIAAVASVIFAPQEFKWVAMMVLPIVLGLAAIAHSIETN